MSASTKGLHLQLEALIIPALWPHHRFQDLALSSYLANWPLMAMTPCLVLHAVHHTISPLSQEFTIGELRICLASKTVQDCLSSFIY